MDDLIDCRPVQMKLATTCHHQRWWQVKALMRSASLSGCCSHYHCRLHWTKLDLSLMRWVVTTSLVIIFCLALMNFLGTRYTGMEVCEYNLLN